MLIEFTVGNFRSFDEPQTLSLVAENGGKLRDKAVTTIAELPLLKVTGIYGANASGKSNLFKALHFLQSLVIGSFQNVDPLAKINVQRFALKKSTGDEPATFDVSFVVGTENIYSYHVELVPDMITNEELLINGEKAFSREKQQFDVDAKIIPEAATQIKLTKPNTLFVSVLAATNTPAGLAVMNFFRNDLVLINGLNTHIDSKTKSLIESTDKSLLLKRLKEADLAINDIAVEHNNLIVHDNSKHEVDVQKLPGVLREELLNEATRIYSTHNVYDSQGNIVGKKTFDFERNESNGTQRFLSVLGPLLAALETGKTVIVDEFGTAMHPLMVAYLISLFQNKDNQNSAQLIFNTQDIITMDNETMRADQIWFTEKNQREATRLLALSDYRRNGKRIRSDLVYNRQYLKGTFGAIPIINVD